MIRKFFRVLLGVLLTLGAYSAFAAVVALKDANGANFSGPSCTYSGVSFLSDGTMNVICTGTGGGTTTSFAISTSPASAATVGSPVAVSVTRTVSGTPGSDSVTVTATGVTTSANTLSTVNFTAGDGASSTKSAGSVTFSAAGMATISGSPAPSIPLAISVAQNGQCGGVTASPYLRDLGSLATIGTYAEKYVVDVSLNNYAVAAFKFTIPADAPAGRTYGFTYEEHNLGGTFAPKTSVLSSCSGDLSGTIGVAGGSLCVQPAASSGPTTGIAFYVGPASGACVLQPGGTYYLNVQGRAPGEIMGFLLKSFQF